MGWVHRTSHVGGAKDAKTNLGWTLTDSTSTRTTPPRSLGRGPWGTAASWVNGSPARVCSKLRMLTAKTTTSRSSWEQKARGPSSLPSPPPPNPPKYSTPSSTASGELPARLRAVTLWPCNKNRRARNCPNLPNPTMPMDKGRVRSSFSFSSAMRDSSSRTSISRHLSSRRRPRDSRLLSFEQRSLSFEQRTSPRGLKR